MQFLDEDVDSRTVIAKASLGEPNYDGCFKFHFGALKAAALKASSSDSYVVACCEPTGALCEPKILTRQAESGTSPYVIVGRHSQAGIRIEDPSVALRHVFVRLPKTDVGSLAIEARDLCTDSGMNVHNAGWCRAVTSNGAVFLALGSSIMMAVPAELLAPHANGEEAWAALPPAALFDAKQCAVPRVRVPDPVGETTAIRLLRPLIELSQRQLLGTPPADSYATIELRSQEQAVLMGLSHDELCQGVLLGRYERCMAGADLMDATTLSRVHALLLADGDEVAVYDTASTFGTVIDALVPDSGLLGAEAHLALGPDVQVVWSRRLAKVE